ncbi:MAG: RpiR family transcriptional regulator [Deltaproteobacteria bacterium]|nr:RpiR family transcriptional regulator [Deltaproteobacteria bacterium]MBP1716717.1 RpiR family transcriptional regulator [Deltaproteobacteria bacterium]
MKNLSSNHPQPFVPNGEPSTLIRIRGGYSTFKKAEQRIANAIFQNPEEVINLSVTELAEKSSVSESSVVRFCKALGYKGYYELKISLARELVITPQQIYEEIGLKDDVAAVKHKVFQSNILALQETIKILNEKELERAVAALGKANLVVFYGMAGSAAVALDSAHKFLRINIRSVSYSDSHMQAISASLLGKGDVAFGISHSGSSKDVVDALQIARQGKATTICLTHHTKSPITKVADIKLYTAARETALRSDAMTSRIAQLSILDVLYVSVALKRYDLSVESIERSKKALADKKY